MNHRPTDSIAFAYLDALDAGDLDALNQFWEMASDSPELARELAELTAAAADEWEEASGLKSDADRVRDLVKQYLPSAFTEEPTDPPPLTIADVAARLRGDPGLARSDVASNDLLLGNSTPLPEQLGAPLLERWTAALPVTASPAYWKLFRKTAVLMSMSRCQTGAKLAAARQAKSDREKS